MTTDEAYRLSADFLEKMVAWFRGRGAAGTDLAAEMGALPEEVFRVLERDFLAEDAPDGVRAIARLERARRGGGPAWVMTDVGGAGWAAYAVGGGPPS